MPAYIPYPYAMIYLTGILEAILGLLLLFNKTRRLSAWGIIALLVFVFPANIQMLINYINENNPKLWIAILRLPLQIPLIYWAWTFTREPIDMKGIDLSKKDTYPVEPGVSNNQA
jgi:uncharacterized membrane protein